LEKDNILFKKVMDGNNNLITILFDTHLKKKAEKIIIKK
jgi:hypothetical protein